MLKHLSLAAILLASAAPMAAHAQDRRDDDGDRYERSVERDDDRGGDRDDDRDREKDRDKDKDKDRDRDRDRREEEAGPRDMRHGDRWARMGEDDRLERGGPDRHRGDRPGRHGPEGRRGPPPPPPQAGFEIRLGEGRSVVIQCGDERIADCVDAAQPVIDAVSRLQGVEPVDRVPPPPSSLVEGDPAPTPPASTPPAPPAADAPTPPAN